MKGIKVFLNTDPEDFPLHWHTALELIMPIRNDYTARTNGETIHVVPGDILLIPPGELHSLCLLYTSDAADDLLCVDLGGRRTITKKKKKMKLGRPCNKRRKQEHTR